MAPTIELPIDSPSYRGFDHMLYDVLEEHGVPTERIKYIYHGEPGPDRLQGHILIHLRVPTSETLSELHAF
jgi:hypothetical protein